MYSRLEEERLEYIRNGKLQQARQIFADDPRDEAPDGDDDGANDQEQLFIGKLPSCFLGSRAWISERVSDALAVCREMGKPSLFVTMTTNPNWPEIAEKLLPGQTAADRPVLVCRAFKGRLDRLMTFFRSARFGGVSYVVSVIEFQKRGLPHVHILLKVGLLSLLLLCVTNAASVVRSWVISCLVSSRVRFGHHYDVCTASLSLH